MITPDLDALAAEWLECKETERRAIDRRRKIEDAMSVLISVRDTDEGVKTSELNQHVVKVTTRLNKTVDAGIAQEIAAEHGLEEYLGNVFRWKPEVNVAAWKAVGDNVRTVLSKAVTVKPGRPTYAITKKAVTVKPSRPTYAITKKD